MTDELQQWIQQFNVVCAEYMSGAVFMDLNDEDQANILECRDLGMDPEEAFEVLSEVYDVE